MFVFTWQSLTVYPKDKKLNFHRHKTLLSGTVRKTVKIPRLLRNIA